MYHVIYIGRVFFYCSIPCSWWISYYNLIFFSSEPPKFGKEIRDQQVELGEQFKIKIPFTGTGPFDVKIKKNGRDLVENGRVKILAFDEYVTLTINGMLCRFLIAFNQPRIIFPEILEEDFKFQGK